MVTTAFSDSTPGGSAGSPKTGDLSSVIATGTDAIIRIVNTGEFPTNFYYREIGETDYDLLQIMPSASAERWITITSALTFQYYFDDSTIRCDVVHFEGDGASSTSTTYTTAAKVASQLRLILPSTQARLTFSASTDPTLLEVENFILEAEDDIDRATNHAWRAVTMTNEYHDLSGLYTGRYRQELPVKLHHRSIRAMVSGTDKIELWDGTTWKDLVLTANGYTEGRANDFWIDYTHGWIYFVSTKPYISERGIRVTYRYGESSVPGDIQSICTLLAAAKIIASDWYKAVVPEGVSMRGINETADAWEKRAYDRLEKRKEIILAH
jgi:hypothetical protein